MKSILAYPLVGAGVGAVALAAPVIIAPEGSAPAAQVPAARHLPQRASARVEDESEVMGLGSLLSVTAAGGTVAAATAVTPASADSNG